MTTRETSRESGFSLIELLVAMVVTLIVTGAMYGLLVSGKGAFRQQPEETDRQQNIRVAMDIIQHDIAAAGMDMPPSVQAFTNNLNNPAGSPPSPNGAAPGGPRTDYLEMFANDGACSSIPIGAGCSPGVVVRTVYPIPPCYDLPGIVMVIPGKNGSPYSMGFAWNPNTTSAFGCDTGTQVTFPPGQGPPAWNPPGGFPDPNLLINAALIRYEIALDAEGVPNLFRSVNGGLDQAGNYFPPPAAAGSWQLIARGIEDLQVQYRTVNGVGWQDVPGNVVCNAPCNSNNNVDYTTLVREVQVTLSSRALGQTLTGQTNSAIGAALRGRLISVNTPRAVLFHLSQAPGGPQWR